MGANKKIGIVTLHGYSNYGNKLQNFALKYVLENMNFEVSTTIITDKNLEKRMRYYLLKKSLKNNPIKKIISVFLNRFKNNKALPAVTKDRENKFKIYSEKYLNEVFLELSNSHDLNKIEEFDFFVTGSDQVWNPYYFKMLPIYFLTFTDSNKRIAYAPSISTNKIPFEYEKQYKIWLNGMSKLSIREEMGADIIKKLINKDIPILADPTLLLSKEEWLKFSNRATNRPDSPYLLTYFLGGPTVEAQKKIEYIAKQKNMTIINLGDIQEKDTYNTGPSEFIDYINNASLFFTDSFHGVVFSIILQTPFIIYERQYDGATMYSRIETILDKFNLKSREANNFKGDLFSIDFSETEKILSEEYNKSIDYLKDAFKS